MLGGMADVREMSTSMWKKLCRAFWSPEFLRFLVFGGMAALANLAIGYILYSNDLIPYFFRSFAGRPPGCSSTSFATTISISTTGAAR